MKRLMKFILPVAMLVLVLAVLTAGCVQQPQVQQQQSTTPETAILGTWTYTFTNANGTETVVRYHFTSGNNGTMSSENITADVHWAYDKEQKLYTVSSDKLTNKETFAYKKDGNNESLISADGKYILSKQQNADPNKVVLGTWKYTFNSTDGTERTLTYRFDTGYTGKLSTGKTKSDIHWLYDSNKDLYMVNYDKLMMQEYFGYVKDTNNTEYMVSIGGGYVLTRT